MTDRAATKRIEGMIAAEEIERAKFKKRNGMKRSMSVYDAKAQEQTRDPNDSDFSDEDDVAGTNKQRPLFSPHSHKLSPSPSLHSHLFRASRDRRNQTS